MALQDLRAPTLGQALRPNIWDVVALEFPSLKSAVEAINATTARMTKMRFMRTDCV